MQDPLQRNKKTNISCTYKLCISFICPSKN